MGMIFPDRNIQDTLVREAMPVGQEQVSSVRERFYSVGANKNLCIS
jgi:hypothetical protein